jgi:type VI secretion system secreted protein Hcp
MAINVFMKICGLDMNGGSTSKGHETEIEVLSWSHGFNQPTSSVRSHGGGGTVEKANHQAFVFTKILDSATDDLLKACWSGKHHATATLTAYRSAGEGDQNAHVPYLKVEMESVIVSDFQVSGSVGDMPMETVALTYAKVTYTYTQHDKTAGSIGAAQPVSHDLRTHVIA